MSPAARDVLAEVIKNKYGETIIRLVSVSGGSVNDTYRIDTKTGLHFFCKTNKTLNIPRLFEKEKNGLQALANSGSVIVPKNLIVGEAGEVQWILMEWIEEGRRTPGFWKTFGRSLAALHRSHERKFGFHEDNFMGELHQSNTFHEQWNTFFICERLIPQVANAFNQGMLTASHMKAFERLYLRLPSIFSDESPSLVHGDLWSGNFICNNQQQPVLIDPAVYYGNRHVDLAMTTLFGGFDDLFYEEYAFNFPLPPNYKEQWKLLNLYPLLIHLNLFGKSYLTSIVDTIAAYE